jgi:xanthine dehydrogenase accessory factor
MEHPLDIALAWHAAGRKVALATVVETWGSAPRPAGSVMVCDERGEFVGSVSGGCVEVAVIEASRDLLQGGAVRVLEFGVSDDDAWAVGLACGGRIRVLVEPLQPALVAALVAARAAARGLVQASALDGEQRLLLDPVRPAAGAAPELQAAAADALRRDAAQRVTLAGHEWLLTPHNPPLRLIVIGAVHIAEALCAMARLAGHAVTLIDPRSAFLRAALFPGVTLSDAWPQQALPALRLDTRCAAVLLSHDPKIDDPALEVLLHSPVYYIGALGSRRTHARRLERLLAAGHTPEALGRIHGPAGLDIGARTPPEIALSVLAQLTASLRQGVGAH